MTVATSIHRRNRRSGSKPRSRQSLQKPNGVIGPRVAKVGGDRFAIVCIDPAKYRSEWLMADYFGKILIAPQTLEHQLSRAIRRGKPAGRCPQTFAERSRRGQNDLA